MKTIFCVLFILLLSSNVVISQADSVLIKFENGFADDDINLLAKLLKISVQNVTFSDSKLFDKYFFFSFEEYKNGKLVNSKPFVKCGKRTFKQIEGNDTTIISLPDDCEDYIKYTNQYKNFKIKFLLQNIKEDSLYFLCIFPTGLTINFGISNFKEEKISLIPLFYDKYPINRKNPFFAISSGYVANKTITSYCALSTKPVNKWYEIFGINHYYIIYLEIKSKQ